MEKRLVWADSLKGVLIILVVFGHAIQETQGEACFNNHLWNIIYSFHMPAFMAISGYLNFRAQGITVKRASIIKRRFQQLLVPFFIWALIRVLVNPPYTQSAFVNMLLYPDGSFWFLWVLFFISVIFYFGDWISEQTKIKQEYVIVAICLALAAIMVFVNIRVLGFQFIAYYFLFYSIGYYLHKYNNLVSSNTFLLLLLTIIWTGMAWFWNMHQLPSFLSAMPFPQTLMQYIYRFVTAVVAIYVLLSISPVLLNKNKRWNVPLLKLGNISLGIYTSHILLMPFVVRGLTCVMHDESLVITMSFVITLLISWGVVQLLNKWGVTSRLLLGKI